MPDLVPVEHDPFGDAPYPLPVDHVPEFGDAPVLRAGSIGAPERAPGESVGGIALDLLSQIPGAVRGALSLPQRAFGASENMRTGGPYDPGPALEAATMTMGATPLGAARGAGEAALGAGPVWRGAGDSVWWHGSASGDLRGGSSGLHLGTKKAATDALEARIGTPADGRGWVGDRPYGETLLAGRDTLAKMDSRGFNITGFRATSNYPKDDFYPSDYFKDNPKEWPTYPDGSKMPLSVTPKVAPYRIKGEMTNTPQSPHEDFRANGYMKAALARGNAKRGYFYTNQGEDAGSISAVVPNGAHIEPIKEGGTTLGAGPTDKTAGAAMMAGPINTRAQRQALRESLLSGMKGQQPQSTLTLESLRPAFDKIRAEQGNISTVPISDLIRESGIPKEQMHDLLLNEAQKGNVTLHEHSSVKIPPEVREAGINIEGYPRPRTTAYLKGLLGSGPADSKTAGAAMMAAPQGIRAYHGSPYDFERFDMSKIGTGEGAQAYGHGLYFAENPATAESYKEALGGNSVHVNGEYLGREGDLPTATAEAAYNLANGRSIDDIRKATSYRGKVVSNRVADAAQRLIDQKANIELRPSGKQYEVSIKADPEHFLDWDKPLSEQSPHVQKALPQARGIGGKFDDFMGRALGDPERTGAMAYGAIGKDNPAATEALRSAGIPGIKYLDQGSRGAGEGTRNYVLFRDDIIDILRKYGLAGLSALPPAVAASVHKQMFQPVDHDPFQ